MELSRDHVKEMFNDISPTYDRANHILSFGIDYYWRRQLASHLPLKQNLSVLDCATGTGDQLLALIKSAKTRIKSTYGLDIASKMVELAKKKIRKKYPETPVSFIEGSVLKLPFDEESLDAVTISFGIRNVTDVPAALKEMQRVLKKEGRVLILEFSLPSSRLIRSLHLLYLRRILPKIGGLISKNPEAYRYLNQTIETFPYGEAFINEMRRAGFLNSRAIPLTFGSVTLYIGEK